MRITREHLFATLITICLPFLLEECSSRRGASATAAHTKDTLVTVDSSTAPSSIDHTIVLTYEQRQGKVLYLKYCSVCHGVEGKGDGFNAFNLDPRPRDLSDKQYMSAFNEDRLYQTIDLGGRGMNKSPSMPSWGGRLDRREIRYVMAYVRSMSTK